MITQTKFFYFTYIHGEGTTYHLYDSLQEQEALRDLLDQPPVHAS